MATRGMFVMPQASHGTGTTPKDGLKLAFTITSTSTNKDTYTAKTGGSTNANPVISDSNGLFGPIWMDIDAEYRVKLSDKNDVVIFTMDNVSPSLIEDSDDTNSIFVFKNVSDMKAGTLESGDSVTLDDFTGNTVIWQEYYSGGLTGGGMGKVVASATGTEDDCEFFDISAGGQVRQIFDSHINVAQAGAKLDGTTNDGAACQNAIYAAERLGIQTVTADVGTILLGHASLNYCLFFPKNVSFQGSGFATVIDKTGLGTTTYAMLVGKPDNAALYYDALGTIIEGTGVASEQKDLTISGFSVTNARGVWVTKSSNVTVHSIDASTTCAQAVQFGDAGNSNELCTRIEMYNLSRSADNTATAASTVGISDTTFFSMRDCRFDGKSNAYTIDVNDSSDGNFQNILIDQQDRTYDAIRETDCLRMNWSNIQFDACKTCVSDETDSVPTVTRNIYTGMRAIDSVTMISVETQSNHFTNCLNSGGTGATTDVVLSGSTATANVFTSCDFNTVGTLTDSSSIVNSQTWVNNFGLEEGQRFPDGDNLLMGHSAGGYAYSSTAGDYDLICDANIYFRRGGGGARSLGWVAGGLEPTNNDDTFDLGSLSLRWDDVYATNGTIQTSDAREKTAITGLSAGEIQASKEILSVLGGFKWLSAIASKGEADARKHIGMTVQSVISIMQRNGLQPFDYAFIIHDSWDATDDIPAVKHKGSNKDRFPMEKGRKAGDRYGFRYQELTMFLMAGLDARLKAAGV